MMQQQQQPTMPMSSYNFQQQQQLASQQQQMTPAELQQHQHLYGNPSQQQHLMQQQHQIMQQNYLYQNSSNGWIEFVLMKANFQWEHCFYIRKLLHCARPSHVEYLTPSTCTANCAGATLAQSGLSSVLRELASDPSRKKIYEKNENKCWKRYFFPKNTTKKIVKKSYKKIVIS